MEKKVLAMPFSKVFPFLLEKVRRKGREETDVYTALSWLTGYSEKEIKENSLSYGDFFLQAPKLNEKRLLLKGTICKEKLERIEDPLWRDIRIFDFLVDQLAKGKSLEGLLL